MFFNLEFDVSELRDLLKLCESKKLASGYLSLDAGDERDGFRTFKFGRFKGLLDVGGNTAELSAPLEKKVSSFPAKLRQLSNELESVLGGGV